MRPGRVLTSHKALDGRLTPLGALMGGFVAAHRTLRGVWWIAAIIHAAVARYCTNAEHAGQSAEPARVGGSAVGRGGAGQHG
ncbi:hypothetical protein GCM10009676_22510 [Prauserella halophila]|uniref:Uncharacterized protein n=1 Tax=Prauserella halophila TaxID=185641 RepID=A0ABP4GYI3_9PSEU|nr:hypothetical protein [Prauserella halophila]